MTPLATVVICTRDRPDRLAACLDALAGQRHTAFDILVIDNGTTDAAGEVCRHRGVACIREPEPGLTRARNRGARAARAEIVAYIDDDAIAEPQWLEALVAEFTDPRVAAVAGHTRYMLSRGDSLEMTDTDAPHAAAARGRFAVDRDTPGWFAIAGFGGIGDGNTMAFRRTVLTSAVRFDERIGRGRLIDTGDEHVAFLSLIADGYRVMYAPEAVVRHPSPPTEPLRRAKRARDRRSAIAYLLFVATQFPAYRRDVARFLRGAVTRRARPGRSSGPRMPVGDTLAAMAGGCRVYWRARKELASAVPGGAATPRVVTIR